ncbi:hypothetical protein Bbelb_118300, partial [Branchiostoma belcheri]
MGGRTAKEFDSRCNMPNNRTQDENQWPFVLSFQSPLIDPQGRNITGRLGHDTLKYSRILLHDKCGATFYIMVKSVTINHLWPAGITPTFTWGCSAQETTGSALPKYVDVDVIFNSTIADMTKHPGLRKEWYTEGEGTDRRILIIINVPHLDTSNDVILDWICQAEVNGGVPLSIDGVHIIFYPIGCPAGKYGGECQHACDCPHNASCHTFTGACKCPAGWEGDFCEKKIPPIPGGPKVATIVLSVLLILVVVAGLTWCWQKRSRMGRYQVLADI